MLVEADPDLPALDDELLDGDEVVVAFALWRVSAGS